MIFFPAIDLKGGQCVRLFKGDMEQATVYADDPAEQARTFERAGCRWIHVVDLDGAVAGAPRNAEAVRAILRAVRIPVQLGGGIRDLTRIEAWLDEGVRRVVLGTAAIANPALMRDACRRYPDRIAAAIDARDGRVAVKGWTEVSEIAAADLAAAMADAGAAALIYTDIGRDGTLAGPDTAATIALARRFPGRVVASGGVSSLADLEALRDQGGDVLQGVIAGRAIYDGRLDPKSAVAVLGG